MWKEYAIEPSCVVQSRETFRFLLSHFGTEHGRWIVKLPSGKENGWKALVMEALRSSPLRDVERGRVEVWLSTDKGRFFGAGGGTFSPDASWLQNALVHHKTRPFAKILAVANPDAHADVLVPEAEIDPGSCLPCPHVVSVQRNTDAIVENVVPLLAKANELLFIDPHFGPEERFLDVLAAALSRLSERAQKPSRIEYHFKAIQPADELIREWKPRILLAIPVGLTVTLVAWNERSGGEQLHDRFI